jgi:hypothetical protein
MMAKAAYLPWLIETGDSLTFVVQDTFVIGGKDKEDVLFVFLVEIICLGYRVQALEEQEWRQGVEQPGPRKRAGP